MLLLHLLQQGIVETFSYNISHILASSLDGDGAPRKRISLSYHAGLVYRLTRLLGKNLPLSWIRDVLGSRQQLQ